MFHLFPDLLIIGVIVIVSIVLTRWILRIDGIYDALAEIQKQTKIANENRVEQYKLSLAQLEILASIADKLGVKNEDINEVTKSYGIEFET